MDRLAGLIGGYESWRILRRFRPPFQVFYRAYLELDSRDRLN